MKRLIYLLALVFGMVAASCQSDDEVALQAGFTTDKETYEICDPVVITNTSTAGNAQIAICKWELGKGEISYDNVPKNISYDQAGEYVIRLTVTSDRGFRKSTFEKTIVVTDNNIRPVADFSYEPEEVVAGVPVQFTDLSTDEDGEIQTWEWKFGTTVSDKQSPLFTFSSHGPTEVTLTVTDNKRGRDTKKITIDVKRGENSLDLLWSYPYDDTTDAYVYGTSPAVSPDGECVYVTSTGYALVCFTKAGVRKWSFDLGKNGASALSNAGSIKVQHPTPSVDTDGTVYAAAGFNEAKDTSKESGLFAISGGADGGSQVWYASQGGGTSIRFVSPVVTEKYVMLVHRNSPTLQTWVMNKSTGAKIADLHANSGSYGGIVALRNGMIIAGTGGAWGARAYLPNGEGKWRFSPDNASGSNAHNYAVGETPNGSQYAVDASGRVYILSKNGGKKLPTSAGASILYCYDANKTVYGTLPVPEWVCALQGDCAQSGMGVVLGEDGTVYASTQKTGSVAARITAVSAAGVVKWEHQADGDINGVPAVDNQGYVYYNDKTTGKLVKVKPADGSRMSEIQLADELRSSPTISTDGIIYVNGMKDGKPTVFAVQGSATGCADSWSQMGGGPGKTGYKY